MHRGGSQGQPQAAASRPEGLTGENGLLKRVRALVTGKTLSPRGRQAAVLALMLAVFLLAYLLPFGGLPAGTRLASATREGLLMLQEYAREHVLLCLVPALFIAGAISCFISQAAVIRYFGAQAHKALAYSVAAISGTILAACSCTVLPLFAGIYTRGAGIGPATAFLYSGPAINVLAIILTARVLGWQLGVARAVGAVVFSLVIGLTMHLIYRREEAARQTQGAFFAPEQDQGRRLWQNGVYFAAMVGVLVFVNFSTAGMGAVAGMVKWILAGICLLALALMLVAWFTARELREWVASTWAFARQILPLLLAGVLVAGLLLGRPGEEALIPEKWVAGLVGGNGVAANFLASLAGALMYFATLTEVPFLQALLGNGMGQGPALALLLAGPAVSLPNLLVIRSIMGTGKTLVYVALVVALSTLAGLTYGCFAQGVAS
jgi:uncharacterized membrane protein YraQ (UPF0718 family)